MLKHITPIIAILVIGGLEAYAISQHINGVLLSGAIAIIASVGVYAIKIKKSSTKDKG